MSLEKKRQMMIIDDLLKRIGCLEVIQNTFREGCRKQVRETKAKETHFRIITE